MTHDLSMKGGLLFVSQALLAAWAGQGRIDLDGRSIALLGGQARGRRYALVPAVRFLRVAGGGEDAHGLVARVKTLDQVREIGGEAMADSVVLGEVAYEVEPGFLAEASAVQAAAAATSAAPSAAPSAGGLPDQLRDLEDRRREAETLARFLLDNLS
jgi:hypothetical protein